MSDALGALAASILAFALARPMARVARALGLVDPRPGAPVPERKRGQPPIALGGGITVLVAACAGAVVVRAAGGAPLAAFGPAPTWALFALFVAFVVGLADDRVPGGFGPAAKFALQLVAAAVGGVAVAPRIVAVVPALDGAPALALGWFLALCAIELANTFDHADGLCGGVGALGLAVACPFAAGAIVGWLPANLDRRGAKPPTAILGDGGAHLVGMALAVVPGAWPALFVPALDLARVSIERVRAGEPIWRGDRRHLGHRLAARGFGARGAFACTVAASAPAVVGAWEGSAIGWALGLGASTLVWWSFVRRPAAVGASGESGGRSDTFQR